MISSVLASLDATSLLVAAVVAFLLWLLYDNYSLPPGPWGVPVLGYLPFLGNDTPEKELAKLSAKYGNVMSLRMGSVLHVVLGDYEALKEAFIKQAENFHGVPLHTPFKVVEEDKGLGVVEGEEWREHRRFTLSTFRDFGMGKLSLEPKIMDEIHTFLDQMANAKGEPYDLDKDLARSVSNIISALEFGQRFEYNDKRFQRLMAILHKAAERVSSVGTFLFFPWAKYVPFAGHFTGFNSALEVRNIFWGFFKDILPEQRAKYVEGSRESYVDAFFTEQKATRDKTGSEGFFTDLHLLGNLSFLFGAGSETSVTTLRWALIYLINHPEIQERVQKEIDDVIGMERTPTMSDRLRMPYTEAVLNETARCGSIVPLSLIHGNIEETTIFGHRIPKRTNIISNLWSVHNDPKLWPNPEQFKPERFLDDEGKLKTKIDHLVPFGIGKRMCMGESLARMELFLFFTSMLQRFKFEAPKGVKLNYEYVFGITKHPKNYQVCAIERKGYQAFS